jgi:hypothetical protein
MSGFDSRMRGLGCPDQGRPMAESSPGAGESSRGGVDKKYGKGKVFVLLLADVVADRKGATAILFGLTVVVLMGFLGLGVETAYWYLEKRELQEATDSAALAGAREYGANNGGQASMEAAALQAATESGFPSPTLLDLNQPPDSGLFAPGGPLADPEAVEVILTETYDTYFVSLFGMGNVDIQTRAVAVEGGGYQTYACILALDPLMPCPNKYEGLLFQGDLDLTVTECSIHSNDMCNSGIEFNGNPNVTVTDGCLTYSGEVDLTGMSNDLSLPDCGGVPKDINGLLQDPYAYVNLAATNWASLAPQNSAGEHTDFSCVVVDGVEVCTPITRRFSPGYYTNDDLDPGLNGIELLTNTGQTNILMPGIYFIDDDFFVNGGTITTETDPGVSGVYSPVILVFPRPPDRTFDFRGNGDLILTAPTAGEIETMSEFSTVSSQLYPDDPNTALVDESGYAWAGLAIYNASQADLGDNNPCPNKINGTSITQISGAIYFPDTCITFTGNNSDGDPDDPCFRLVAGNITLSGNVTMSSAECDMGGTGGGPRITYGTMVGLVE